MTSEGLMGHLKRGGAFLVVGGGAFVVDAVTYNVLVFWPGPLADEPIWAKIISIAIASVFTYVGNRLWTFADRKSRLTLQRAAVFVGLNLVAIALQLGCLSFSRYVLHLSDPVSDNVSGTLIGQALATVFRYVTYGRWVFPDDAGSRDDVPSPGPDGTALPKRYDAGTTS
ncbi:GtrA family protein [Herbiconiux sp. P18]|uniref:GtrA family protein n=1 Tax=Herbiconiux liangxiaofengii TaxID=3342795 RepID=UPI0035BA5BF6